MNVVCIIQARTGSTRLPAKVLRKVQGKELLLHCVDRVLLASPIKLIVVATTVKRADDAIADLLKGYHSSVSCFRGSEDDVLDRYYQAAVSFSADTIVRITSDCPLIDPFVIDRVVKTFQSGKYDYVSNTLARRTYPRGLDVEVVSFKILKQVWECAWAKEDREHVTWYIRQHPNEFRTATVENDRDLSSLRWTVDEEADFALIKRIYDEIYPDNRQFTSGDIMALLDRYPELKYYNSHVEQKKIEGKSQ